VRRQPPDDWFDRDDRRSPPPSGTHSEAKGSSLRPKNDAVTTSAAWAGLSVIGVRTMSNQQAGPINAGNSIATAAFCSAARERWSARK
jgi:hypothetical protein